MFNIFNTKSDQIANAATPIARMNLDIFFTFYEEPPGFWSDEYVLGFHFGQITTMITAFSGNKATHLERGEAMAKIFEAISGRDGIQLTGDCMKLLKRQDPDFNEGAKNGGIFAAYSFDAYGAELPDIVRRAALADREMNGQATHEGTCGMLRKIVFSDRVKARFPGAF